MAFVVDFFEEYHPLGGVIQVRITVTNNDDKDIEFTSNSDDIKGHFRDKATGGNLSMTYKHPEDMLFDAAVTYYDTLKVGEPKTFERVYMADADFFRPDGKYIYVFEINGGLSVRVETAVVKT